MGTSDPRCLPTDEGWRKCPVLQLCSYIYKLWEKVEEHSSSDREAHSPPGDPCNNYPSFSRDHMTCGLFLHFHRFRRQHVHEQTLSLDNWDLSVPTPLEPDAFLWKTTPSRQRAQPTVGVILRPDCSTLHPRISEEIVSVPMRTVMTQIAEKDLCTKDNFGEVINQNGKIACYANSHFTTFAYLLIMSIHENLLGK